MIAHLFLSTPIGVIGYGIAITIWYSAKACWHLLQRFRKANG